MTFEKLLWLIPILLAVHNLEEFLTSRKFATPHFQRIKRPQFLVALIFVTVLAAIMTYFGTQAAPGSTGMFLALATQAALLVNAVIHIVATIRFKRYTPGVVTSIALYLPYSFHLFRRALSEGYIAQSQLIYAFILGAALMAPIIWVALSIGAVLTRRKAG